MRPLSKRWPGRHPGRCPDCDQIMQVYQQQAGPLFLPPVASYVCSSCGLTMTPPAGPVGGKASGYGVQRKRVDSGTMLLFLVLLLVGLACFCQEMLP